MRKLQLALLMTGTVISLAACDSGSSNTTAAQVNSCLDSAGCKSQMIAQSQVPLNAPPNAATNQVPAATGVGTSPGSASYNPYLLGATNTGAGIQQGVAGGLPGANGQVPVVQSVTGPSNYGVQSTNYEQIVANANAAMKDPSVASQALSNFQAASVDPSGPGASR